MKFKLCAAVLCACMILTSCVTVIQPPAFTETEEESNPTVNTETEKTWEAAPPTTSSSPLPPSSNDVDTAPADTLKTPPPTPSATLTPTPSPIDPKTPYGKIESSATADKSYFDDAVFIGDSVSMTLKTYSLTGVLGKANIFAVGSYSVREAIKPLSEAEVYPSYQGKDMTVADCVKACGGKKVYIMLGMNDIAFGVDLAVERYKTLISQIKEKSPDVEIFIQSMTPMLFSSSVYNKGLTNPKIKEYNSKLLATCIEMGWYFVDVAEVMYDANKEQLNKDYCSDAEGMGLHLNTDGTKVWVEYLLTHTADLG